MSDSLTIEQVVHFDCARKGRKQLHQGEAKPKVTPGRVPRISKLMALAVKFERLLRGGHVESYTELAALGHVSRARLSQVMNLTLLAPDIQEEILFLPRVDKGRDPIIIRDLQPMCLEADWKVQRSRWRKLQKNSKKR